MVNKDSNEGSPTASATIAVEDYSEVVKQLETTTAELVKAQDEVKKLQEENALLNTKLCETGNGVSPNAYVAAVEMANRAAKLYNIVVYDGINSVINAYGSLLERVENTNQNKVLAIQQTTEGTLVRVEFEGGIFEGVGTSQRRRNS